MMFSPVLDLFQVTTPLYNNNNNNNIFFYSANIQFGKNLFIALSIHCILFEYEEHCGSSLTSWIQ